MIFCSGPSVNSTGPSHLISQEVCSRSWGKPGTQAEWKDIKNTEHI